MTHRRKIIAIFEEKNKTTVIFKTGRSDNIDAAVIMSSVSKAVQEHC